MLFAIKAALAQVEHEIKRERIIDSISNRREAEGPRRAPWITDSKIRNALRLVESGEPATQIALDLALSYAARRRPTLQPKNSH